MNLKESKRVDNFGFDSLYDSICYCLIIHSSSLTAFRNSQAQWISISQRHLCQGVILKCSLIEMDQTPLNVLFHKAECFCRKFWWHDTCVCLAPGQQQSGKSNYYCLVKLKHRPLRLYFYLLTIKNRCNHSGIVTRLRNILTRYWWCDATPLVLCTSLLPIFTRKSKDNMRQSSQKV